MLDFCKKTTKDIYIYGCGNKSILIYKYLRDNDVDIKGFIVSNGQDIPEKYIAKVWHLNEIEGEKTAIVLGLSYCFFNEIFPDIISAGIKDIFFVNGKENWQALNQYDEWFSEKHENEEEVYLASEFSYKMSQKIFEFLLNSGLEVKSAIDIGGGLGVWMKAFKDTSTSLKRDEVKILVVDGCDINREKYLEKDEFLLRDLTKYDASQISETKYDIAVSIEVAEHLDEKYADGFVENLCKLSDIVLFSAAVKYQGGAHHVNERQQSYWKEKFERCGYKVIDCVRPHFWNDESIDLVVRQNCFLYVAQSRYEEIKDKFEESVMPIDVIHPQWYNDKMEAFLLGLSNGML